MWSLKRDSAYISDHEPTFRVRYVGCTETSASNGTGCTIQPLKRIWDNSPSEKHLLRVVVRLGLAGLTMTNVSNNANQHFPIENVSFCAADQSVNPRLFCWIFQNGDALIVHAVLCSTRHKAQAMAAVTARAFYLAYRDWKAEKQREERKK
ncbi:unnamed protein product, partial [Lymnaea stagnalis]